MSTTIVNPLSVEEEKQSCRIFKAKVSIRIVNARTYLEQYKEDLEIASRMIIDSELENKHSIYILLKKVKDYLVEERPNEQADNLW